MTIELPSQSQKPPAQPLILAPAGNRAAFLAALAAGADAVYCGLKQFSARMEAKNFDLSELARLTRLAHDRKVAVYVTLNTLFKPDDLTAAFELIFRLEREVHPDALIVQDLAAIELAHRAGFTGELHLSTLANVSFPAALALVHAKLKVSRVVVPRELSVDEIKIMAKACPPGLWLETFIHGALCYGVSGRCYWSSYLGGKSGLRGRCVQPCRRMYAHRSQRQRFFSCQDLSLDVLVKVLAGISQVCGWKIEGRKKGPHYVYYTVTAYRLLRDEQTRQARKKDALDLLAQSLGRTATHYHFLSQRPRNPIQIEGQTGSGMLLGRVQGPATNPFLVPREALLPGDMLRIGYEDEAHHTLMRINRAVPGKGKLYLKGQPGKRPMRGSPVFLVDRREEALNEMIARLEAQLEAIAAPLPAEGQGRLKLIARLKERASSQPMTVFRRLPRRLPKGPYGLWLSALALDQLKGRPQPGLWWWLPPVIWPETESLVKKSLGLALEKGCRNFMLNAAWQVALFSEPKGLTLWAGPFCNIANPLALESLKTLGFHGAIVSPELGKVDYLALPPHSPLPLGVVISGSFPLCISRVLAEGMRPDQPFESPRGETAWVRHYDSDYWLFANWKMDLTEKQAILEKAGYRLFVHLDEPVPANVAVKKRPGLWNWETGLR
jgi:putative protease